MKKFKLLLFSILLGGIFLLGTFPAVWAQAEDETAAEEEFTLEEITVTAEKTGAKDLQKISTSISVITGDEISKSASTNFADALSETAGITFQSMFGQVYIRGVGSTTNENDVSPGVQINVDNAPILTNMEGTNQSPMFALTNDVERIEIIRGPSGSVNGRSASSGTINIISKSPSFDKVDGNVGITYGNFNTVQLNAALNLPMQLTRLDLPSYLEDLSFRLAVAENKHGAYITNSDGEDVRGLQNQYSFRGKIKWQPFDPMTLDASLNYSRQANDTSTEVPLLGGFTQEQADLMGRGNEAPSHYDEPWVDATGGEMSTPSVSRQYSTNYEVTYETGFANIYGRYSYSWVPKTCREDEANCYEGKQGEGNYEFRFNSPNDSRIVWNIGTNFSNRKTFTGPESEAGVIDEDWEIKFQDWYSNGQTDNFGDDKDYFTNVDTGPYDLNDPLQPWNELTGRPTLEGGNNYYFVLNQVDRASKAYSVFANISIPLFEEKHRAVLGLRKNFERKKRAYSLGIFAPQTDPEAADYWYGLPHWTFEANTNPLTGEAEDTGTWYCDNCYLVDVEGPKDMVTDDNPINFTLGWEYDWIDDVMLYFMVKNGFKPGGISQHAFPLRFYEEETMLAYTIGMKSRWFDQRLQLNVDAYVENYDNYQQSLANSNMFLYTTVNGTTYSMVGDQSSIVNFPRTYIYGLDLDYEWLITSKDHLSGNVAYNHADYADFKYDIGKSSDAWVPEVMDFSGRVMPYSPRWTLNASYRHTFYLTNFYVTPKVSAQYKTKYYLNHEFYWEIINTEMWQPAYTLFDAYMDIGPQDGTWSVSLYWKNLTEEPVRILALFNTVRLNDPMTYGARFSMSF